MPHTKITQAFVDGLPFHDSTTWFHDTDLAGFNMSVGRRSKTFYVGAEHQGRYMRVKIGRADVTKANEARAVARDILLPEIRRGVDPRALYYDGDRDATYDRIMRGIRMSDEKAELALRGRRRRDVEKVTVGHVWAMYEEFHLARLIEEHGPERANRAKKHISDQRRLLGGAETYLKDGPPAATLEWPNGWWERPITSITPELCSKTWRNLSRTREPGRAGWREVQLEARVFLQPGLYLGRLVRGVVVEHQVHLSGLFHRAVDAPQKPQELLGAEARQAFPNDQAGFDIERREQRGRAMALVVMGHRGRAALLERQSRLGSIECLDLGFLIDAEHDRAVRRVEVETDDLGDLFLEQRIVRDLEGVS